MDTCHQHLADGLYPSTAQPPRVAKLPCRQPIICLDYIDASSTVRELTMTEAPASATPLAKAQVKVTSPGAVLLDDEDDSPAAPS